MKRFNLVYVHFQYRNSSCESYKWSFTRRWFQTHHHSHSPWSYCSFRYNLPSYPTLQISLYLHQQYGICLVSLIPLQLFTVCATAYTDHNPVSSVYLCLSAIISFNFTVMQMTPTSISIPNPLPLSHPHLFLNVWLKLMVIKLNVFLLLRNIYSV